MHLHSPHIPYSRDGKNCKGTSNGQALPHQVERKRIQRVRYAPVIARQRTHLLICAKKGQILSKHDEVPQWILCAVGQCHRGQFRSLAWRSSGDACCYQLPFQEHAIVGKPLTESMYIPHCSIPDYELASQNWVGKYGRRKQGQIQKAFVLFVTQERVSDLFARQIII